MGSSDESRATPSDGAVADGIGPASAPSVTAIFVDTADSLLVNLVANRDDNLGPGDASDAAFDVAITGPFDGLILLSVADGEGGSLGGATQVWDTLSGDHPFPQTVSPLYQRGGDSPVLGVSLDGDHLVNRPDGSLPAFGPGEHRIRIFADGSSGAFRTGRYFRLVVLQGDALFWGPAIEFSWGRPAIEETSVDAQCGLVDRVGEGDTATHPGGLDDGAFDVELDGPLDALILVVTTADGMECVWDTIVGDSPFPKGVSVDPAYQRGSDTWVLGVADSSGFLLNGALGTLPRLSGHQSLRVFATDIYLPLFAPSSQDTPAPTSTVQLVGLIGDLTIWGPRLAFPE
jgi:hypothetical protein